MQRIDFFSQKRKMLLSNASKSPCKFEVSSYIPKIIPSRRRKKIWMIRLILYSIAARGKKK